MTGNMTDRRMLTQLAVAGGMYLGIAIGYFFAVATPWFHQNTAIGQWFSSTQPLTTSGMFLITSGICLVLGLGTLYYTITFERSLDSSTRVDA